MWTSANLLARFIDRPKRTDPKSWELSRFMDNNDFDREDKINKLDVDFDAYKESQINLEREKIELERKKIEQENKKNEKEQLLSVHSDILKKIEQISNIRIPNDKEELLYLLSELSIQVNANKWSKDEDEESIIRNKYNTALCEKYRQSIFKLESISPQDPQLKYHKKILAKNSRNKIKFIIKIVFLILICMALFYLTAKYPIIGIVFFVIMLLFSLLKSSKKVKNGEADSRKVKAN